MVNNEIIIYEVYITTNREKNSFIFIVSKYMGKEGKVCINVDRAGRRIKIEELMVPERRFYTDIPHSIWCRENQLQEACTILYNTMYNKIKENIDDLQKKILMLDKMNTEKYSLIDNSLPIVPFKGEIRL